MRPLRVLSGILAAVFLLPCFTSCSGISDSGQAKELLAGLSQNYRTDAHMSAGDIVLEGYISRENPGACIIELSAPESLSGLRYEKTADGVEMFYRGLSFTADRETGGFAGAAPFIKAADALSALLLPEPKEPPVKSGGHWELRAELDGRECALWFEEETKLPVKLLMEDGEIEILLENFIFFD